MRRALPFAALVLFACEPPPAAKIPYVHAASAPSSSSSAAPPPLASDAPFTPTEVTTYVLHKFMQDIGSERDTFTPIAGGDVEAHGVFSFRDRGTTVPLAASYVLAKDGTPLRYEAWGSTSRFTLIDERATRAADGGWLVRRLDEKPARVAAQGAVPGSGYAPILAQQVLLRVWKARGRPASIDMVPAGRVQIASRGKEPYDLEGKTLSLEHVAIAGLVWGREDAWLDDAGKLVAVVTRDAEFDHFEAVRRDAVAILPKLVSAAGADGVAWLAQVAAGAELQPGAGPLAIVGGRLIDGTGKPPVDDAVVVVENDHITAAGPRASTKVPPNARTIDASGKTIMPGLWDMHAHLEQIDQAAAYLGAGVTTVRDLGNILEFVTGIRDAIASGKGVGPRVLVDGLVDGEGPWALGTVRVRSAEDVPKVLDKLKAAGCLEVKIYSSVSPQLVPILAREAHARGMGVTGHVPEGMDAVQAIEGGYDAIDHLPYVVNAMLGTQPDDLRKLSDAERARRTEAIDTTTGAGKRVLDLLAQRHVVVDDTIALYELLDHRLDDDARREPGIAKLPPELRGTVGGLPPERDAAAMASLFDTYVRILGALHKAGVPIVAGTDIAVPGHSLHRELEIYVQAGFTPMEAIQAATIVPARVMKKDKELGTLEIGKRGDLIVVDGDPLTDVRATRAVRVVVAAGHAYDPAKMWQAAGFVP